MRTICGNICRSPNKDTLEQVYMRNKCECNISCMALQGVSVLPDGAATYRPCGMCSYNRMSNTLWTSPL